MIHDCCLQSLTFYSTLSRDHLALDFGDRLTRIKALGAGAGAVENRMTAIQPKRIIQFVQALAGRLITAVGQKTPGLQEYRGA